MTKKSKPEPTKAQIAHNDLVLALSKVAAEALTTESSLEKSEDNPLVFALKKDSSPKEKKAKVKPQIAFQEDPNKTVDNSGLFKLKSKLLPDTVIKDIRVSDHLIAAILRARGNHASMFGTLRKDRFDIGVEIDIKPEFVDFVDSDQMAKIKDRIAQFKKFLMNCGKTDGLTEKQKMNLATYFEISVQNGLSFGRFTTECVYEIDEKTNEKVLNRFRPTDAGTIYHSVKNGEAAEGVRMASASTLTDITGIKVDMTKLLADEYSWIQVINGTPRQAFTDKEMLWCSLFPSSDIEHNGYPVTPLDTVISSVTTHLNILTYNRLYFQNGRGAKGFLVVKSDEVTEQTIQNLRQQYQASINSVANSFRTPVFGVGKEDDVAWVATTATQRDGEFQFLYDQVSRNVLSAFNISPDELPGYAHLSRGTTQQGLCLDLSSTITTDRGLSTLSDILGDKKSINTLVWTGKKLENGRVFLTGEKLQSKTTLDNGTSIITSPDHRFLVVGETEPVWKRQSDLSQEDFVLVNKKPCIGQKPLSYNGMEIGDDLWEILGWMTGDGCLSVRENKNTKQMKSGVISLYYHSKKERFLWEQHFDTLKKYGLEPSHEERFLTDGQIQKRKDGCFSKTAAASSIKNTLYSNEFVKFLLSLGFKTSKEGKVIPSSIHALPETNRAAFLRGLFSADGTLESKYGARVVIHDNELRSQTKSLLLSLGIRTQSNEGNFKWHPNRSLPKVRASTTLSVKDKDIFFEKVGFLQPHKQPKQRKTVNKTWNKIPQKAAHRLVNLILASDCSSLTKSEKNNLHNVLNPKTERTVSADKIVDLMKKVGLDVPWWLVEYHIEKVVSVEATENKVTMADVEIFDDFHAFVANGMVVHNSESSSEYKLTAARDTGLRPLITKMQSFVNDVLFPIIDPELAQLCLITLAGLDAQTQEQESVRLQTDMPLYYDYDEVMRKVEKDPVGEAMGGQIPFNTLYRTVMDTYLATGRAVSRFTNDPSFSMNPTLKYRRDSFYFQYLQLLQQSNPYAYQAEFATNPQDLDTFKWLLADMLDDG